MLFSSMTFLYVFLPIVCGLYLLFKKNLHNAILLIASVIFYAWGEPRYLSVMILTIIINYYGALIVSRSNDPIKRKRATIFTVLLDLSFLVYFKYSNFLIWNVNALFTSNFDFIQVAMPIGISFYTFQAISYVIDVYRKEVEVQTDIYKLALFISLFPQLVAGPIVKYHDIAEQIDNRQETFDKVALGIKRFIVGLAKKMLIANTMGAVADKIFVLPVEQFDTATAWVGILTYTIQLYFDFSGYSDMAIGLCLIFGFNIPENFNYPYISKSITEFWRRWHISLSTWFKLYLYFPLGGNRISSFRTYVNLFLVFTITGIWHGASWNFVIWGVWNGIFIVLEKATGWAKETPGKLINAFKHVYLLLIFIIGLVIFRSETMPYAWDFLKNMFGFMNKDMISYQLGYFIDNLDVFVFIVGCILSTPIVKDMLYIRYERKVLRTIVNLWLFALFLLSSATVAASTYNPFIYFRF